MGKSIKVKKEEVANEIEEIVKRAKAENRDFTEEEQTKMQELRRNAAFYEAEELAGRMRRNKEESGAQGVSGMTEIIRDAVKNKKHTEIMLRAEGDTDPIVPADTSHMTDDLGPLQPLTVGEFVEKVEEDLIWTKIGIRMPTGLAGQYEWPVIGDLEAEFAGEGAALTEKKIDISKVPAVQQRAGVVASRTNQAMINSRGVIDQVINTAMPKAIARAVNNVVMNPTKVAGQSLQGPFVTATAVTQSFDFKGLNAAKAVLLGKGYEESALVFVMDAATKAELEATPKDAGSGIMTIENGKLCGCPVFVSSKLNGKIGLGDFRFQVVGQFGQVSLVIDPYSQAEKGKTRFVLETNMGTATLDKDAFLLISRKAN